MKPKFPMERTPKNSGVFLYGAPLLALLGAFTFIVVAGSLALAGKAKTGIESWETDELAFDDNTGSEELESTELAEIAEKTGPTVANNTPANSTQSKNINTDERSQFIKALSEAFFKANISHEVSSNHDNSSYVKFKNNSLKFALGSADLDAENLRLIDKVGTILDQANQCMGHPKTDRKSQNVFLGSISSVPCAQNQGNVPYFQCDDGFRDLKIETMVWEGHADSHLHRGGIPSKTNGGVWKYRDNLDLSTGRAEAVLRRIYTCTPSLSQANNWSGKALFSVGGQSSQRFAEGSNGLQNADRRVELKIYW